MRTVSELLIHINALNLTKIITTLAKMVEVSFSFYSVSFAQFSADTSSYKKNGERSFKSHQPQCVETMFKRKMN